MLSVLGDLLGGVGTDRVTARFGSRVGRCGVGDGAYLDTGIALLLVPLAQPAMPAASLMALATAVAIFVLASAWAIYIDLGQENAAVVSAVMNTTNQIGSLLCPLLVAYALKWYGSWNLSNCLMSVLVLFLIGRRRGMPFGPAIESCSRVRANKLKSLARDLLDKAAPLGFLS